MKMMNFSTSIKELITDRKIKPGKFSFIQVQARLNLAYRDLKAAEDSLKSSSDWDYNIAYNAMLQAGRTLMFQKGFRPIAGEGGHWVVIEFLKIELGGKFKSILDFMDEMRKKRNRATYDMAGLISDTEARESVKIAKDFVLKITKIIDKLNPQKKLQLVNR